MMADAQGPSPQPAAGAAALPPELQAANASKEDRSTAMIAHLLGLVAIIGPLIFYFVKKDTASKYVMFHIKQVLWLDVFLFAAVIVLAIIVTLLGLVTGGLTCFCFPLIFLLALGGYIYNIVGAIQVNSGKDFQYIGVGPWVAKSM
jgi:uncharacterized Tic20 family protein